MVLVENIQKRERGLAQLRIAVIAENVSALELEAQKKATELETLLEKAVGLNEDLAAIDRYGSATFHPDDLQSEGLHWRLPLLNYGPRNLDPRPLELWKTMKKENLDKYLARKEGREKVSVA